MQKILIFDVDGTLTGPRRVIHEDFARFFHSIVKSETVYLVSGSDMPKLESQLPAWLIESVTGVFTCSGNELVERGQVVFKMEHSFPDELLEFAQRFVADSSYELRTGNHIELRTGALNVSVVGRNADPLQRKEYEEYDSAAEERDALIAAIEAAFPEYEANRGGQISIDVSPRGWNKSRVYPELSARYPEAMFYFFGDNIRDGGNDLPLAEAIKSSGAQNKVYAVENHFETWKILQEEFASEILKTA